MSLKKLTLEELTIGMEESLTKTITEKEIQTFAELTGDINPVHLDKDFAKETQFKQPIAHGMLSASYFSTIFGTQLPGVGSIYVSQSLKFKSPVYIDDTIKATVTIKSIDLQRRRVAFDCICCVGERVVIVGESEFYIPS